MAAEISQTSLAKKLGIPSHEEILLIDAPDQYLNWFSEWPEAVRILRQSATGNIPFIHIFCLSYEDMEAATNYIKYLKKDGCMWISWPKRSSGINSALNGNLVRDFFLQTGLVDTKVASISEIWSGLKFVYRLRDR